MARKWYNILALVMASVAVMAATTTNAQSMAAAPPPGGTDCFTVLASMSDCLTYVEIGSNLTKPDKACCPELAGVVDSNPICLCQLLGNPGSAGVQVDVNKAMKLPSVCKVSTPPVSMCSAVGVPVASPPMAAGKGPSSPKATPVASPGPMMAPTEAPPPSPDCLTVLANMSDCLGFVTVGSNQTKPDKTCCSEFAGVVDGNPICLCKLLGDPGSTGIPIDVDKALKLPSLCSVSTPPVSLCSAIGVPVGAPAASPGGLAISPSMAASPTEAISPTSVNNNSNGDLSIATHWLHGFIGFAITVLINSF